jgi:hypothetical protein
MANLGPRTLLDDESPFRTLPPLAPDATPGQRWRFRRNLVIFVAHREGFSKKMLADVFDLPRSRIAEIIKEISLYENSEAEPLT